MIAVDPKSDRSTNVKHIASRKRTAPKWDSTKVHKPWAYWRRRRRRRRKRGVYSESHARDAIPNVMGPPCCRAKPALTNQPRQEEEEEEGRGRVIQSILRGKPNSLSREEEFITSGDWRGKHNSMSRVDGPDPP